MSLILRAAFWLTVLAFLLPAAGPEASPHSASVHHASLGAEHTGSEVAASTEADIDAGEMLSLAARSAQDMMGFCDRNPDVCARGQAVVTHVARQTAFYGGKLFQWLTEKAREPRPDEPGPETGPAHALPPPPHPLAPSRLAGA